MNSSSRLYGSLVLTASTPLKEFAVFENARTKSGNHTESKYRGQFALLATGDDLAEDTVALPQRNKYMMTSLFGGSPVHARQISSALSRSLTDLDSRFDGARQLYKMQQLMLEIDDAHRTPYLAVINNTSEHSSFTLLSRNVLLYLLGVFDTTNGSVRLVWTTDEEFIEDVRREDNTRYVFYRFPVVYDRPLFVYTQSICSKWYQWTKIFTGADGLLKTFNALEQFLFKDPEIAVLERKR